MSNWTDFRDSITGQASQALGVGSAEQAAQTTVGLAGEVLKAATTTSDAQPTNGASTPTVSATKAVEGTKTYSWLSGGMGIVLLLGVVWFVLRRQK